MGLLQHRRLRTWIEPYVDSELGAARASQVAEHLQDCPDCCNRAQLHRMVRTALRRHAHGPVVSLPVVRLQRFAERSFPR